MKTSELMIGDIITFKDSVQADESPIPVKVVALGYQHHGEKNEALVRIGDDDTCDIVTIDEEFVGYPLTAEILEKNGIKLEEVGDNGISTPPTWRNRFEKWVLRTQWKDTFIWYDRTAKYWHLHDMGAAKLLYVHELQRALRCCGLYEEANNITV